MSTEKNRVCFDQEAIALASTLAAGLSRSIPEIRGVAVLIDWKMDVKTHSSAIYLSPGTDPLQVILGLMKKNAELSTTLHNAYATQLAQRSKDEQNRTNSDAGSGSS